MPRVNLTEAEYETLRKDREVRTLQAVAYNQAIDDILQIMNTVPAYQSFPTSGIAELKREIPAK